MTGSKLNLQELQKKFDELLAKETKWSLTVWIYKDRMEQFWHNLKNKFS